ncbi:MAG: hypothetical protein K0R41_1926 [Geminicoccaceae bacterium]|nr:hypothetical protein [Geminicoccaceae bacterium]
MFSLEGRRVVIIGGSYGMGYATALMAIDAGAELAIAARGAEGSSPPARRSITSCCRARP